jgi:hypothetical protein
MSMRKAHRARHVGIDDLFSQVRRLTRCDHPAHDIAAENIQDDVQMEAGPFRRSLQLGNVPLALNKVSTKPGAGQPATMDRTGLYRLFAKTSDI